MLERAVLLSQPGQPVGRAVAAGDGEGRRVRASAGALKERLEAYEKELLREALQRHGGVLRRAAAELGVDPVTFGRKAKRYGLHAPVK